MNQKDNQTPVVDQNELRKDIELTMGEMSAYKQLIDGHLFLSADPEYKPASRKWHGEQVVFYTQRLREREALIKKLTSLAESEGILIR
jgi:hypothetical protein